MYVSCPLSRDASALETAPVAMPMEPPQQQYEPLHTETNTGSGDVTPGNGNLIILIYS